MILDKETALAEATALTASGAGGNKLNLRTIRHLGIGHPIGVLITIDVEPDETTGDETYVAKLRTDDLVAFGSPTDLAYQVTIPRTATTKDRFWIPIPPTLTMEQFLDVYLTLGGTTPTITFSAYVMRQDELQGEVYYAKAYEAQ